MGEPVRREFGFDGGQGPVEEAEAGLRGRVVAEEVVETGSPGSHSRRECHLTRVTRRFCAGNR